MIHYLREMARHLESLTGCRVAHVFLGREAERIAFPRKGRVPIGGVLLRTKRLRKKRNAFFLSQIQ